MLDWLETSSVAIWVGQSPSIWALPAILTLHTTGMALLVGACAVLDLRLLGIGRRVPLAAFGWVFRVVAIGLTVNLATGVLLFVKAATTWGTSVPFLVKMLLVAAGAATLLPLRSLVGHGADAGTRGRSLAIASIVAWTGAVTAGRLLAYIL